MKIGILTSSRADYGIYLPLLGELKEDNFFELEVIVFGAHLSRIYGYTLSEIEQDGYKVVHKVPTLLASDDELSISTSFGLTSLKFADFWQNNKYDIVLCLGDRFEMCAAVQAGIPFGVNYAHLHGGETTLGAIDNVYRHQISIASSLHFTAAEGFTNRLISILGSKVHVYTVGSLSLDGVDMFKPISKSKFYSKLGISSKEFILVTFHPETVDPGLNIEYARIMRLALKYVAKKYHLIITMPNADTLGSIYRSEIHKLVLEYPNGVSCVENFGKANYFTAMKYSKFLIGNSSSGIVEAATFSKYVVNVGNRQGGRLHSLNVINADFNFKSILSAVNRAVDLGEFNGENIFYRPNVKVNVKNILKNYYEGL